MNLDSDDLPDGWQEATLGEVAHLVKDRVEPSDVPQATYLGLEHVEAHTMKLVGSGRSSDVKSTKTQFRSGDVLYGKLRPYLNKVAQPGFDGICSTDFLVLRSKDRVNNEYIANYLNQLWVADRAHQLSTGVELPRVDWKTLSTFPILFPTSLEEQQQVVGMIQTARASGSSASAHLELTRRATERLRQTILRAACTGTLTCDWRASRPSEDTARDLVERIHESRSRDRRGRRQPLADPAGADSGLPEHWTWVRIGDIVEVTTGATPLRKRHDYYHGSVPWVTSGAVNAGRITEPTEYITELALRETNAKMFPPGTLVIAMYGEGQTRGRVAELGFAAATNQALGAILFDEANECLRAYLRVFLLHNYERVRLASFGGVQPNLTLGVIRDIALPLPPLAEQAEIVRRVELVLELISALEDRVEAARRGTARSSQAVLASALRGSLLAASGISA